jgi:Lsr2
MGTRVLYYQPRNWSPPPFGTVEPSCHIEGTPAYPEHPRKAAQMAKQTTVTLVDDLDGSEAEEQVEFAFEGKAYEIDLSATNSARLRSALEPFVSAARRTGGRRRSGGSPAATRPSTDREQNQAIREWAQEQGMKISERGRIPSNVLEAYHQSH